MQVHRTYSSPRSQTYTSRLVPLTSASPRTSDVEVRTITGVSAATRSQRWQGHVQSTVGRISGRSSYGSQYSCPRMSRSPDASKEDSTFEDVRSPLGLGKPVVSQGPPATLSDGFVLKKDGGALSSSTMAPDEASFRSDEANLRTPEVRMPITMPTEPVTLRPRQEDLRLMESTWQPKREAREAQIEEARTPEGVTTKHPPRRPVKAPRLSRNDRRLSVKDERLCSEPGRQSRCSSKIEANEPGGTVASLSATPQRKAETFEVPATSPSETRSSLAPRPAQLQDPASSGSLCCWALKSLDEGQAAQICATQSLEELSGFELRISCPTCKGQCPDHIRCRQRNEQAAFRRRAEGPTPWEVSGWHNNAKQSNLGTWMVWMVHRVYLNDPSLERLDFGCFHIPRGDKEPRILPKLFQALTKNTHLKHLMMGNTALESSGACIQELAAALRSNSTLQKLDVQANFLEMCDLTVIFEALAENTGLKDLKVNLQACAKGSFRDLMKEQGNDVYKAAAAAFRSNRSLIKLDLILLQRHWQDQICRGLMQNKEEQRKSEAKDDC